MLALSAAAGALLPGAAPALVTFDCTGALFELRTPISEQYKRALCAQCDPDSDAATAVEALSVEALETAFVAAYREAEEE